MVTSQEPKRCARCGNDLSFPHFSGGLTGGVYCTWICAMYVHRATGYGVYRLRNGNYEEVTPRIVEETV